MTKLKELSFLGQIPYCSPEILAQIPYNPLRIHVWSLRVCLYVIFNYCYPFDIYSGKVQMIHCQLNRNWRFKRSVSQKLSKLAKQLIIVMLELHDNYGPTSAQIIAHSWVIESK